MGNVVFEIVEPSTLEYLRKMQLKELRGPVIDFNEEGIVTYHADFVRIQKKTETIGYACIGTAESYNDMVLEYYIDDKYRSYAGDVLKELARQYCCKGWFVNTHDFLTLPIMLELKLAFEIDAYQFTVGDTAEVDDAIDGNAKLEVTKPEETEEVYQLIMQDGFYSGGGIETLKPRIEIKELYSLRIKGRLIGVGFVSVLLRTPSFADIAMIIDKTQRGKGWGVSLVKSLINKCQGLGIEPVAVCGVDNVASRKTLQKAGFGMNGCILLAHFEN